MFNDPLYIYGDQNVQVPAHLNFGKYMLNFLRQHVLQHGDDVAFENADTDEILTYKELTKLAVNLAVGLTELGVGKGDVVALGTEKSTMFIPIELATVFAGATFTSYEIQSGKSVLHHKLTIARPKYFICSNQFWETNSEVLRRVESIEMFIALDSCSECVISLKDLMKNHYDVNMYEPVQVNGQIDTALILYSSGTTGMPKGVQLTHLNCILASNGHDFKDETLVTVFVSGELYHNYDFFMAQKMICLGQHIVYVDNLTCENILKTIEKYRVNIAFMVPSIVGWLAKAENLEKYSIDSLKVIYSRSSPLHMKTMDRVKRLFSSVKHILQGYGMTEAGELTSENWGPKGPRPGSVGGASPGITLKVVDPETRKVLGPNERGEICLKGPVFMKGYIEVDPSSYLDEQGFFKTGDLGYYDEDENFYIVDRLKEIITVYDGCKVAPLELETILLLHPGVREAGVVGVPESEYGEKPLAFVVRQPGVNVTEKELIEYVATEAAPLELETILLLHPGVREAGVVGVPEPEYGEKLLAFVVRQPGVYVTEKELIEYVAAEVPHNMQLTGGVRFITEMPKSYVGKVLRRRLREMLNKTH